MYYKYKIIATKQLLYYKEYLLYFIFIFYFTCANGFIVVL